MFSLKDKILNYKVELFYKNVIIIVEFYRICFMIYLGDKNSVLIDLLIYFFC